MTIYTITHAGTTFHIPAKTRWQAWLSAVEAGFAIGIADVRLEAA